MRYIKTLDLNEADVRAVYPSHNLQVESDVHNLVQKATRQRIRHGNSLLLTGGTASQNRWFARVVGGIVMEHDYNAHMENIQHEMLHTQIAPANEGIFATSSRLSCLGSHRMQFLKHRKAMIDRSDREKEELRRIRLEGPNPEMYGDIHHASYVQHLDELRARYVGMTFWAPADHYYDIQNEV